MSQEMVTIHLKDRKTAIIPKSNLSNFKRLFFSQIDYIEEQEGDPIIEAPIIEEVGAPIIEEVNVDPEVKANDSMTKKELQTLAKDLEGYKSSMTKAQLIELINA